MVTTLPREDHGALSTVKNGPRLWTVDYIGIKEGKERDSQGLHARWVIWFPIPNAIREGKDLPYSIRRRNDRTASK